MNGPLRGGVRGGLVEPLVYEGEDGTPEATPAPQRRGRFLKQMSGGAAGAGGASGARPRTPATGIRLTKSGSRSGRGTHAAKGTPGAAQGSFSKGGASDKGKGGTSSTSLLSRGAGLRKNSRSKSRGGTGAEGDALGVPAADCERFFAASTVAEASSPKDKKRRGWTSLRDPKKDPYGIFGQHPCPTPGPYAQLLDVRSVPEGRETKGLAPLLNRFS